MRKDDQIFQRFDKLEAKVDKLIEDMVPQMREDMATLKEKNSNAAKIITAVGGAITLVVSMAMAHYVK